MFSIINKRFLNTNANILHKIIVDDIKQIGPYTYEADWICNMIENEKSADEKDGHSGFSFGYTKLITDVINKDGFPNWKNNYVHLSFDNMFQIFYFKGFAKLGNKLITTSFDSDLLENFNKIHKHNNYDIKEPILHLRPFMKELVKKYPELK